MLVSQKLPERPGVSVLFVEKASRRASLYARFLLLTAAWYYASKAFRFDHDIVVPDA